MSRLVLLLVVSATMALAACDNVSDSLATEGSFRALHAVHDLNRADFFVAGASDQRRASLQYRFSGGGLLVAAASYEFWWQVRLPGETTASRILEFSQFIDGDRDYSFVLTGTADTPALLTWERARRSSAASRPAPAFGHAAQTVGPVDMYLAQAPNTDPAALTPQAQIDFGEFAAGAQIDAGAYQLIVTGRDAPATVLFESAEFSVAADEDPIFALLDAAGTGTADFAVSVAASRSLQLLEDVNAAPELRFVHAALATDSVDLVLDDNFANPLVSNLAYPNLAAYAVMPTAEPVDIKVASTGNTTTILAGTDPVTVDLSFGDRASLFLLGPPENLEVVAVVDDNRGLAGYAKLRLIQADPTYGAVNVYLVDPGEGIGNTAAVFANLAYRGTTGYLEIVPGSYDLYIRPTGSAVELVGPVAVTLQANQVYGYYILDTNVDEVSELRPLDDAS